VFCDCTSQLRLAASGDHSADTAAELRDIQDTLPAAPGVEPLLTAGDFMAVLRVSSATFWRLRSAGKLPRPITSLGAQLLRWLAEEVRRWIATGMPDLKTWEALEKRA
jgi:predicted DNA-binding transcriptional regulator AlpA